MAGIGGIALAGPLSAAPKQIDTLWWLGTAHVEVGGRSLDIAGETRLRVPLLQVRSTTFIVADGRDSARTLILEPDGQWVEQGGVRKPLPPQLGIHERQQYAIYGWLLLMQQAKTLRRQMEQARSRKMRVTSPPWPDAVFEIGADAYPVAAEWTVEDSEPGKPPIAQRMTFAGRIDSNGVRWPRQLTLTRAGEPYFALTVADFRAS